MVVATDRYVAEDAVRPDHGRLRAAAAGRRRRRGPRGRARWCTTTCPATSRRTCCRRSATSPAAIAAAPHVLELDLEVERSASHAAGGHGRLRALGRRRGPLRVYTSTQTSTGVRAAVAAKLGLPLQQGRVHRARRRRRLRRQDRAPVAGGGPGPVGGPRGSDREVKWTEDRREHFVSSRARARPGAARARSGSTTTGGCSASTSRSGTTTAPTRRTASSCRSSRRRSCSGRTSPAPTGSSSGRSTPTR